MVIHLHGAQVLVLALWVALSVFVLWVALVSVVEKRQASAAAKRQAKAEFAEDYVPEATPEELMQARSMGLYAGSDPPRN